MIWNGGFVHHAKYITITVPIINEIILNEKILQAETQARKVLQALKQN